MRFKLWRRSSAPVARERLQILLEYERRTDHSEFITTLCNEIVAVIAKHVPLDPEKVQVKVERGDAVSMVEVDVEIPNSHGALQLARG